MADGVKGSGELTQAQQLVEELYRGLPPDRSILTYEDVRSRVLKYDKFPPDARGELKRNVTDELWARLGRESGSASSMQAASSKPAYKFPYARAFLYGQILVAVALGLYLYYRPSTPENAGKYYQKKQAVTSTSEALLLESDEWHSEGEIELTIGDKSAAYRIARKYRDSYELIRFEEQAKVPTTIAVRRINGRIESIQQRKGDSCTFYVPLDENDGSWAVIGAQQASLEDSEVGKILEAIGKRKKKK